MENITSGSAPGLCRIISLAPKAKMAAQTGAKTCAPKKEAVPTARGMSRYAAQWYERESPPEIVEREMNRPVLSRGFLFLEYTDCKRKYPQAARAAENQRAG